MTFKTLDNNLKNLLIYYLITLGIGFSLGVLYVYLNSEFTSTGMLEQYLGNDDEWSPKLPKTLIDLVSHYSKVRLVNFYDHGLLQYFHE